MSLSNNDNTTNNTNNTNKQGRSTDPLCVRTVELAKHIQEWKDDWLKHRPLNEKRLGENFYGKGTLFIGPMQYLAQETGLAERTISRVLSCESKTTAYRIAELIVLAMNMPYLLSPGGPIQVIPNPAWTQEKWIAYLAERGCEPYEG